MQKICSLNLGSKTGFLPMEMTNTEFKVVDIAAI